MSLCNRYLLLLITGLWCRPSSCSGELFSRATLAAGAVGFVAARIPHGYVAFPLVALAGGGIGAFGDLPISQHYTPFERVMQGSVTAYSACLGYAVGRMLYYSYLGMRAGYSRKGDVATLTEEQHPYHIQYKYCKLHDFLWKFTRRPAERWEQLACVGILLPPALMVVMTLSRQR